MRVIKSFFLALILTFAMEGMAMAEELTVSAAASLTDAFNELKTVFEKERPGLKVNVNYAASNPLLRQITAGAPVDVFASADQATMDSAARAKVINPDTRVDFAKNSLVLIVPKGGKKPANLEELASLEKIAIGDPDSVPAGRYAKQALTNAGMWDKLQNKAVQSASVRQALEYVAGGMVDAGFVYKTDAAAKSDKVDIVMAMDGHDPVSYPIAVALTGNNARAGKDFVNFALSPQGQEILAKYGFDKP